MAAEDFTHVLDPVCPASPGNVEASRWRNPYGGGGRWGRGGGLSIFTSAARAVVCISAFLGGDAVRMWSRNGHEEKPTTLGRPGANTGENEKAQIAPRHFTRLIAAVHDGRFQ